MSRLHTLEYLGLSTLCQPVYETLLKYGPLSIADLSRRVGKHRPMVYKTVGELIDSRLVSQVKIGKRITYKAESPTLIQALVKKREQRINYKIDRYQDIYQKRDKKPKITFFEGKEGIATAYEQLLNATEKQGVIYRYESPRDYQFNKKYYTELYRQRAGSQGDVDKCVITNEKTNLKRRNSLNRISKAIPSAKDLFEYNITELIGKDRVIFIDYDSEIAIMIENERFAHFQKVLYKLLFEKL